MSGTYFRNTDTRWNHSVYLSMIDIAKYFKINLNQNLWGLLASYGLLGVAEFYNLRTLFWFSLILSIIMTISICITTYAYTVDYLNKKK